MNQVDDQMTLLSGLYPLMSPPLEQLMFEPLWLMDNVMTPTVDKPTRSRRRRKKDKAELGLAELKKRRLSAEQVSFLEKNFDTEHKLQSERKVRLASEIGLDPRQVAIWFQNRRARWKSKQLGESYERLKEMFELANAEKCKLESEVGELKGKLAEVQKELSKLREKNCSSSPSLSLSPSPSDSINAGIIFGEELEIHQPEYLFSPDYGSLFSNDWSYSYFGLI